MSQSSVSAIRWANNQLILLDQRKLPLQEAYVHCVTHVEVADAIRQMVVRGAPAIGIAAAYGVALAAAEFSSDRDRMHRALETLADSRPTAVNLFWALRRMRDLIDGSAATDLFPLLVEEATRIHEEDLQANLTMGELGADLIAESGRGALLTHCNTGSLATGGYGTALGVIRSAYRRDLVTEVFADETRPWLQGARLTAWELCQDDIPVKLIADSAAAHVMKTCAVKWVIVGADRITAHGDVANKIGTYGLAVLARHHGVKFMVAAPSSTIDFELFSGADIPIEERTSDELKFVQGIPLAPEKANAFNPVFDVTPAELIDAIVTERGVVLRPNAEKMRKLQ
ncbi:S-methyl-5-thioribose-1-phosphate isomerase [Hahella sp. KA22]|uniref:S-methyl-5-thioribose-1-phosphate isomerase n=1 Tax=Hahella sp. KA22 TaxID=1628392 RepID=UPI000FDF055A|nr:S-methyl-5-thioribose-1-phosphate isomerase [Hahella sp. KA22]AZZ93241.1 S-methyl-5-thioribose-1-phosphate isomerase [Hahella sp. KA22]QAY56615.1 S-methyl-5-thioribose-1-phosphate isomerase [Hahella sp. KA22]